VSAWILIFVFTMDGFQKDPPVFMHVEFASLPACQAAAQALRGQLAKRKADISVSLCAEKGAAK
jgi:hypothetical protein